MPPKGKRHIFSKSLIMGWLLLILILSLDSFCDAFFVYTRSRSSQKRIFCQRSSSMGPQTTNADRICRRGTAFDDQLVELPIFPLRKYPRLPTDFLTLNLYEDRYLQMSRAILSSDTRPMMFGALFVGDLPQIVSRGVGPPTPMLHPGLVGTLFVVQDWREDNIPTVGQDIRPRIRLEAIGVARFQVASIVSDGTSDDEESGNLPYVVCNASLIFDGIDSSRETLEVQKKAVSTLPQWGQLLPSFCWGAEMKGASDDVASIDFDDVFLQLQQQLGGSPESRLGGVDTSSVAYRDELWSFFVASQRFHANGKQQPRDLVPLLSCDSTEERLLEASTRMIH